MMAELCSDLLSVTALLPPHKMHTSIRYNLSGIQENASQGNRVQRVHICSPKQVRRGGKLGGSQLTLPALTPACSRCITGYLGTLLLCQLRGARFAAHIATFSGYVLALFRGEVLCSYPSANLAGLTD